MASIESQLKVAKEEEASLLLEQKEEKVVKSALGATVSNRKKLLSLFEAIFAR